MFALQAGDSGSTPGGDPTYVNRYTGCDVVCGGTITEMKMLDAMRIIDDEPQGFMVSFEWKEGSILRSDHFPDKHASEPLIETEQEAWVLATRFAMKMKGKVVNVYVTGEDFVGVDNYGAGLIKNR